VHACGTRMAADQREMIWHCFLSQDWRDDSQSDRRMRVARLHEELQNRGLHVWCDAEGIAVRSDEHVANALKTAVDRSHCTLIFISKKYIRKVGEEGSIDKIVLDHARATKCSNMIPVIMEPSISKDPAPYLDKLGFRSMIQVLIDLSSDDDAEFERNIEELAITIHRMADTTRQFGCLTRSQAARAVSRSDGISPGGAMHPLTYHEQDLHTEAKMQSRAESKRPMAPPLASPRSFDRSVCSPKTSGLDGSASSAILGDTDPGDDPRRGTRSSRWRRFSWWSQPSATPSSRKPKPSPKATAQPAPTDSLTVHELRTVLPPSLPSRSRSLITLRFERHGDRVKDHWPDFDIEKFKKKLAHNLQWELEGLHFDDVDVIVTDVSNGALPTVTLRESSVRATTAHCDMRVGLHVTVHPAVKDMYSQAQRGHSAATGRSPVLLQNPHYCAYSSSTSSSDTSTNASPGHSRKESDGGSSSKLSPTTEMYKQLKSEIDHVLRSGLFPWKIEPDSIVLCQEFTGSKVLELSMLTPLAVMTLQLAKLGKLNDCVDNYNFSWCTLNGLHGGSELDGNEEELEGLWLEGLQHIEGADHRASFGRRSSARLREQMEAEGAMQPREDSLREQGESGAAASSTMPTDDVASQSAQSGISHPQSDISKATTQPVTQPVRSKPQSRSVTTSKSNKVPRTSSSPQS